MPLSWNEIKSRAIAFSHNWINETSEDAEAKSFLDDFFNVFGISRRKVATFEHQVRFTPSPKGEGRGEVGYIDLFWKGAILKGGILKLPSTCRNTILWIRQKIL